jgi:ankyrin repeat protein
MTISMNLQDAIEAKDVGFVRSSLASGANPNGVDKWGAPLLIRAINLGQAEIAELLISNGANVNARNGSDNGSTPLHWAAGDRVCKPNVTIAKLLLAKGAEVDARTGAGNTPLIWAAKCKEDGAIEVAELLLRHGADLNYYGDDGTALSAAREEGTPAMAEMLHRRRKASLPGNRNLGEPEGLLPRFPQVLGFMPPTPRCPKCRSTDVEQTDILPKREVWECNACKHGWSFWYPPYQHRNKKG